MRRCGAEQGNPRPGDTRGEREADGCESEGLADDLRVAADLEAGPTLHAVFETTCHNFWENQAGRAGLAGVGARCARLRSGSFRKR